MSKLHIKTRQEGDQYIATVTDPPVEAKGPTLAEAVKNAIAPAEAELSKPKGELTQEEIQWGKFYRWLHDRAEYLRRRERENKEQGDSKEEE